MIEKLCSLPIVGWLFDIFFSIFHFEEPLSLSTIGFAIAFLVSFIAAGKLIRGDVAHNALCDVKGYDDAYLSPGLIAFRGFITFAFAFIITSIIFLAVCYFLTDGFAPLYE